MLAIDVELWDEPAEEQAPPSPAAQQAAGDGIAPLAAAAAASPRALFEAAHAWRVALQARNASARDVNAALAVEAKALAVLTGNEPRYNRLLSVAVHVLTHHPAALADFNAAMAAEGM